MKSAAQLGLITAIAVVGGLGNWLVDGRPSGIPERDFSPAPESELRDSEVTLRQLDAAGDDGVLWIDARPREDWKSDGLPGSLSITALADEPLSVQIERHAGELLDARMLVIYCDGPGCALSHELAERLRADYAALLPEDIRVLHGGHVALRAAGRLTDSSPSS